MSQVPSPLQEVSHEQIDLSWVVTEWDSSDGTAVDGNTVAANVRQPTGYRVDVSADGFKWTSVLEDNTNLAIPEFSHESDVKAGDNYQYRVFPIFASRLGPAMHTEDPATATAPTAPGNVRNLRAEESGAGRIMVTWDAPTKDGGSPITGYLVQVSEDQTAWTDADTRLSCELTYTHKGLDEESTRSYRVIALNSVNEGDPTSQANLPDDLAERSATTTEADLPPAPIGLTVDAAKDSTIRTHGDRGVLVYWNAPDDPDGAPIENYRVEQRVKADSSSQYGDWTWVQTCLATSGTLLYTHCTDPDEPDLAAGEERMYKVAAQNAAGIGTFTDPITTPRPAAGHTHPPTTAELTAPATVTATVSGSDIMVTWTGGSGPTGYKAAVGVFTRDFSGLLVDKVINDATSPTTITGVPAGEYVVVVATYDTAAPTVGMSTRSNVVTVGN